MVRLFLLLMVAMASANTAFGSVADVNIVNSIAGEPPIQVQCHSAKKVVVLAEQTLEYGHRVGFGFTPNIWGTSRYICDFNWGIRWQSFDVWVDDFWKPNTRPCLHCLWTVTEEGFFRQENGSKGRYLGYIWKKHT